MIEFQGELSNECKKYLCKDLITFSRIIALFFVIIFSIPIIIIGIKWETIFLFFLIGPIMFGVMLALPKTNPQIANVNSGIPIKVIIENGIIEREGDSESNYNSRSIASIKKIVDRGNWYHIIFYFGYKDVFFICQKNLITQGTIEEFEELFKDKLIRKN